MRQVVISRISAGKKTEFSKPESQGCIVEGYEYQLIRPFTIIKVPKKINYNKKECLVKPVSAGICGSDLLYFKGDKDPRKLYPRLPLVLLHEGVVKVVDTNELACIVPFKTCGKCYSCLNGMENLCENSQYMGSNIPGLSRSIFHYSKELILNIPSDFPLNIATILEPMSVVYRMISEVQVNKEDRIAVIGTGLLGLLTVIFLSKLKQVDRDNLYLVGRSNAKLKKMQDLYQPVNVSELSLPSLKSNFSIVVEAVGGHSMTHSLSWAVKMAQPAGLIIVFGLSDNVNNINFTNIIKKGLKLVGFSRSKLADFTALMALIRENQDLATQVERAVDSRQFFIRGEEDLTNAFHYVMSGNNQGRVLVFFEEGQ